MQTPRRLSYARSSAAPSWFFEVEPHSQSLLRDDVSLTVS
jgi:hypothetical protein